MKRILLTLLVSLAFFLVACGQPPAADAPPVIVRNVSAITLKPEAFKVEIKLPCTTKPREVIELRAARGGRIAWLPFKEGDDVPASLSPNEAEKLEALKPVARIEDNDLQVMLTDRNLRLESARRALQRVKDYADSTREQLDQAQTAFDLASADVKTTEQHIRDTYIVSPMAGVLTKRMRQKGEYVNPGELIAQVSVLKPMLVNLDVPEAHIARVKLGDSMSITFAALNDAKFAAKVTLVDKVAHPQTHTFRVEMEIENADQKVPAGIFGTLMLTIYDKPDAIVVPFDAIKLEGTRKYVMVIGANNKASRREVEIGQFANNHAEVTSGLKAGERIAGLGARLVNDGDEVAIRNDPTTR